MFLKTYTQRNLLRNTCKFQSMERWAKDTGGKGNEWQRQKEGETESKRKDPSLGGGGEILKKSQIFDIQKWKSSRKYIIFSYNHFPMPMPMSWLSPGKFLEVSILDFLSCYKIGNTFCLHLYTSGTVHSLMWKDNAPQSSIAPTWNLYYPQMSHKWSHRGGNQESISGLTCTDGCA